MNKQNNSKPILKWAFLALLVFDLIGLALTGVAMFPTIQNLASNGTLLLIVGGVMCAVVLAVLLFEIFAKVFLIRSVSPQASRRMGRGGCVALAVLLLVFNFGAAVISLLATGGEGATLVNQARLYWQMVISVVEMITAVFYLCAAKKIFAE